MPDEAIRHLAAGQFPALEALQIGWAENEWDADAIQVLSERFQVIQHG